MSWDWSEVEHVLCIRLDNMGDVLMCTPAMRALRVAGAKHLTLLTSEAGARLAPHIPEADTAIAYDPAWVKNTSIGNHADLEIIERLRRARPDAAVIFTTYSQSPLPAALMCHLAGIPRVLAHCRENPYRLISDWVKETEPATEIRHEVQRQLDLVNHVGAQCDDTRMSFHVDDADRISLRRKLISRGIHETGGWICVHAGATAASRRYPAEMLMQALIGLRGEGRRILLLGGHEDPALSQALERSRAMLPGLTDLSGQLTLGELGAVLEAAGVMICNNSGPAHLSAALGVPVVDMYALTNPQHTPWRTQARVLYQDVPCKYCYRSVCEQGHHACLTGVAPQQVTAAARELLNLDGHSPAQAPCPQEISCLP
ncbi:glycosyltransferase family 9 protein [Bordetella sp. 15P40C-2]|uniref:glycosyltransferase family 9 protein n=1 Tax=Bordetella sp. 15P40C-2 TaxID=2572246 RepID=UPI00132C3339|nr:glycosyltransferase family 9 protein [Bordetella sp. 15P40C-2]MVW73187.1 glycosyl transferase [Bordetella sp. 15P40C-2]